MSSSPTGRTSAPSLSTSELGRALAGSILAELTGISDLSNMHQKLSIDTVTLEYMQVHQTDAVIALAPLLPGNLVVQVAQALAIQATITFLTQTWLMDHKVLPLDDVFYSPDAVSTFHGLVAQIQSHV